MKLRPNQNEAPPRNYRGITP